MIVQRFKFVVYGREVVVLVNTDMSPSDYIDRMEHILASAQQLAFDVHYAAEKVALVAATEIQNDQG